MPSTTTGPAIAPMMTAPVDSIVESRDVVRNEARSESDSATDHDETCCTDRHDVPATPALVERSWAADDGVGSVTQLCAQPLLERCIHCAMTSWSRATALASEDLTVPGRQDRTLAISSSGRSSR